MNNRVNYTYVGAGVVILVTAMILFIYWLLRPTDERVMRDYRILFTESVSGLNIDSPVKFRGITIGNVKKMRINPLNSEEIEVRISVEDDAPIKVDTVATLVQQGITGLRFIDLSMGSKNAALLLQKKEKQPPVIPSRPSFFERFDATLTTLSKRISTIALRLEELLNEHNQKHVGEMLEHAAALLKKFESTLDEQSIGHFKAILSNAEAVTAKLDAVMPRLQELADKGVVFEETAVTSLESITESYQSVALAMESFRRFNDAGHYSVKNSMEEPMHVFKVTMAKVQELFVRIDATLEQFERSPSDILFKEEAIQKGPGEE